MSNDGGFLLDSEAPEQCYSIDDVSNYEYMHELIDRAKAKGVKLVTVWEAEGACIAILPERVAKILVPLLDADSDVLEPLGFIGDVLPQDVLDIRKERKAAKEVPS